VKEEVGFLRGKPGNQEKASDGILSDFWFPGFPLKLYGQVLPSPFGNRNSKIENRK
jgi:hypothetical protein